MLPGLSSPETIRQRQSGPAGQRYEREAAIAKPKIQNYCSGRGLRKDRVRAVCEERTFTGRSCGFSEAAKFSIQNSRLRIRAAACGGRTRLQGAGGLCRPRLRPAQPFQGRFLPKAAQQPSGRACDAEEQPSARGRLRAAGRKATDLDTRHSTNKKRLRDTNTFK